MVKGVNSRLDEIQAAVLRIKLKYLDNNNEKRREIARFYIENIKNSKIVLPNWSEGMDHTFHLFVIRIKERNELKDKLENAGIQTMIHYPIPPHKQSVFYKWNDLSFPITEEIHEEVLSLPMWSSLSTNELKYICSSINNSLL